MKNRIIKKNYIPVLYLFITFCCLLLQPVFSAQKPYTLTAGVSINQVPKTFYGTWRVSSHIIDSNNSEIFKQKNVDLWNLSRAGDVITLENPFSKACASIIINEVNGNYIKFEKKGTYDNQKLTDTVRLTLGKDSFTGENYLKLDTISDIDGHVIKTQWAKYRLIGEKISGESIK